MSKRAALDSFAAAWQAFADKLPEPPADESAPVPDGEDPTLHRFIEAFCHWEASATQASAALVKLGAAVVDYNELRVCLESELTEMLGSRTPLKAERAARMRAAMREIFEREHALSLQSLTAASKREARAYLDALEGVPQYVAARVTLLALGGHAFPLDERLRKRLAEAGAIDPELNLRDAAAWLERQVRAQDSAATFAAVEHWAAQPTKSRPAPAAEPAAAPRTKKKTTRTKKKPVKKK